MNKEENKIKEQQLQNDAVEAKEETVLDDVQTDGMIIQIAQLEAALEVSESKIKDQIDSVLRARADVENMRRRTEQEIEKAHKFALERFATELLPVIDNMERALGMADKDNDAIKSTLEGVEMTLQAMKEAVEKFGLKELNPHGEAFNPDFHQAMSIQESADHEPNTVMVVMQKGYELNGRVLRPAMVMVSKALTGNVDQQV